MPLLQGLWERLVAAAPLLTLLAAYAVAVWALEGEADAEPEPPLDLSSLTTWLGLGALVGARLGYALPRWPAYLRYPLDLLYITTGLSFYGGLVGVLLAALLFSRRHGLAPARLLDLAAPAAILGVAVYRLACPLRGDCGGAQAAPPLGLVLPGATVPRYPVEIWEGLLCLALFGLLVWRRGRTASGWPTLAALTVYPLLRAACDLFRLNLGGWPTPDQLLALLTAALAGLAWLWQARVQRATAVRR